jgi:ATP-binding cassette, subfamily B, bacterial
VKGFGAERVQATKLRREADDINAASLGAARVRAIYLPFIELLPAVGLIAVLGVGGHRVLDGELTIGQLVEFNFYVQLLVWPLRTIGMTVAFGQRAATALQRIDEVLDTVPAIVDPPAPVPLGSRAGAVSFDDVRFGYDPDEPVLDGFSLDIEPGTSVAVVGATGSGKSTLARLLVRFYDPQRGSIRLDGVDLRDLAVHDVRRSVGLVFEDTLLFHDTVAANIAFANPDADPDTIRRAAELAGAADFVDDLPEGYDTILGERGFSLSGGQRQRIAIARALVSDPSVLVLDDATSAVDPSKEHEIRAAMSTVMQGRTTIVIAHRPGTIAMADRVVLVGDGRVVAAGTHDELLATEPRYRQVLAAAELTGEHDAAAGTPRGGA